MSHERARLEADLRSALGFAPWQCAQAVHVAGSDGRAAVEHLLAGDGRCARGAQLGPAREVDVSEALECVVELTAALGFDAHAVASAVVSARGDVHAAAAALFAERERRAAVDAAGGEGTSKRTSAGTRAAGSAGAIAGGSAGTGTSPGASPGASPGVNSSEGEFSSLRDLLASMGADPSPSPDRGDGSGGEQPSAPKRWSPALLARGSEEGDRGGSVGAVASGGLGGGDGTRGGGSGPDAHPLRRFALGVPAGDAPDSWEGAFAAAVGIGRGAGASPS